MPPAGHPPAVGGTAVCRGCACVSTQQHPPQVWILLGRAVHGGAPLGSRRHFAPLPPPRQREEGQRLAHPAGRCAAVNARLSCQSGPAAG